MSVNTRGVAELICWDCQGEVRGVAGEMRDVNEEVFDDGPHFHPDAEFKCPHCGEVDNFAWSDFEEEVSA
jgi:hypothetical protein